MEEQKPIKRSKELTPLSKEHHDGLMLIWKIRQGQRNGTDIKIISQYVQWFWEHDLQQHFRKEEEVLVPLLPRNNELVHQMMDEHQEIEALIHVNTSIPDESILNKLADALHDHIRFEERKLFSYIEEVLSPEQLQEVGQELSIEKQQNGKWDNEFWLKK